VQGWARERRVQLCRAESFERGRRQPRRRLTIPAEERAEDEALRDGWFAQLGVTISGDGAAAQSPEGDRESGSDDRERDSEPDDRAPPV
jgi:hypothetical protein